MPAILFPLGGRDSRIGRRVAARCAPPHNGELPAIALVRRRKRHGTTRMAHSAPIPHPSDAESRRILVRDEREILFTFDHGNGLMSHVIRSYGSYEYVSRDSAGKKQRPSKAAGSKAWGEGRWKCSARSPRKHTTQQSAIGDYWEFWPGSEVSNLHPLATNQVHPIALGFLESVHCFRLRQHADTESPPIGWHPAFVF